MEEKGRWETWGQTGPSLSGVKGAKPVADPAMGGQGAPH